jgi:hypothetical protein
VAVCRSHEASSFASANVGRDGFGFEASGFCS